jgi:vesicle transport through interaction with t-SNAREs protein 1
MDVEIPSMPVSIRKTFTDRLATSKSAVDKAKRGARDARAETQRQELLSSGRTSTDDPYFDGTGSGDEATAFSTRTRLLAGTEALSDSSRRLDNAHRIALETEDVGTDILRNLRGQREQIEHTRDSLTRADGSIDRAAGTLKKMIYKWV